MCMSTHEERAMQPGSGKIQLVVSVLLPHHTRHLEYHLVLITEFNLRIIAW
jgi:hypothetical protein